MSKSTPTTQANLSPKVEREAFDGVYSVMTPLCLHMTAEMARNCRTCNPQQMQIDREDSE